MADDALLRNGFRYWSHVTGTIRYECWYRLTDDGQIELLVRGHHLIVPLQAVPLLPESIARTVLANMLESGQAVDGSSSTTTNPIPPATTRQVDTDDDSAN